MKATGIKTCDWCINIERTRESPSRQKELKSLEEFLRGDDVSNEIFSCRFWETKSQTGQSTAQESLELVGDVASAKRRSETSSSPSLTDLRGKKNGGRFQNVLVFLPPHISHVK